MAEESARVDCLHTEERTEEFQREADVDLVVEGVTPEVHSTILCQPKVLQGAVRDTENRTGRVIKSLFPGTTVEEADSLLCHLYSVSQMVLPDKLQESKTLIDFAMEYGFDGLVKKLLDTLTMNDEEDSSEGDFLWHLRSEWREQDPDSLLYWLDICSATSHTKLEDELSYVLATSCFFFKSGEKWKPIRENLLGNPRLLMKILDSIAQILKENVHDYRFKNDGSRAALLFRNLKEILQGGR
ncbi:hypothetical protein BSKO_10862 [Bryopsis sp. KO-2023]|nr:hypothetical protein BSKO_10862 [Bryopsis sp. KO-2023]